MSDSIHNALVALAAEFEAARQSCNKRCFPKDIWKRAIALAKQCSIGRVCKEIKVHPAYLKSKMSPRDNAASEMSFVELVMPNRPSCHLVKIHFESSAGHKMTLDGIEASSVVPIVVEFLSAGGEPCCK